MAAIDFEAAWVDLKAYIVSRPSHGQRDLLKKITEIEVGRRVPEGQEAFADLPRLHTRRTPARSASA